MPRLLEYRRADEPRKRMWIDRVPLWFLVGLAGLLTSGVLYLAHQFLLDVRD